MNLFSPYQAITPEIDATCYLNTTSWHSEALFDDEVPAAERIMDMLVGEVTRNKVMGDDNTPLSLTILVLPRDDRVLGNALKASGPFGRVRLESELIPEFERMFTEVGARRSAMGRAPMKLLEITATVPDFSAHDRVRLEALMPSPAPHLKSAP